MGKYSILYGAARLATVTGELAMGKRKCGHCHLFCEYHMSKLFKAARACLSGRNTMAPSRNGTNYYCLNVLQTAANTQR